MSKNEIIQKIRIANFNLPDSDGNLNLITVNATLFESNANCNSVEYVEETIRKIEKMYHDKLSNKEFTFYCWYDALAGQLRSSAIGLFDNLPFECRVNNLATPADVARDLFSDISSLYSHGALDVYVSQINSP